MPDRRKVTDCESAVTAGIEHRGLNNQNRVLGGLVLVF